MVVVVCSVLLQKSWSAKYAVTWNTWGDRQTGIHQYLVMGISWSRDPQGFLADIVDERNECGQSIDWPKCITL
jgi:hypothetical protein